jgi:membrane protein required for colicin V production
MNWIDILILVVAIGYAVSGLAQGAIRTAFGIVGLIIGVYLAGQYYSQLGGVLFGDAVWGAVAAYIIILLVVIVAATIGGWFVAKIVHKTPFQWLDRILGAGLGLVLGMLTCAAIIAVIVKYLPPTQEMISQSVLARFMLQTFPLLLSLLPAEFKSIGGLFT